MLKKAGLLALGLLVVSVPAMAHDHQQDGIVIDHPWSRPTPPGTPMGVGYMVIRNQGDTPAVLTGGATPAAERVSVHETTMQDGLMRMEPLKSGLTIPPGDSVELKPHGHHLMLESLSEPLAAGEKVPLTLRFEGREPVEIMLHVAPMDTAPETDHSSH